jgi:hypothetical protein
MHASLSVGWRAAAAAICGAAILVGTAACGASGASSSGTSVPATPSANPLAGLTADKIANKAFADLASVSSVHIAGSLVQSSQALVLNLTIGANCTGTVEMSGEGTLTMLRIGKKLWIKPDSKFWKSAGVGDPAVMSIMTGKYLVPSAKDSDLRGVEMLCNPSWYASQFGTQTTGLVKGGTSTIFGQRALGIRDPGDPGIAYVTFSARPEPLRLDAGSSGHLNFTGYNAPVLVTPPPPGEVLDGAKYGF